MKRNSIINNAKWIVLCRVAQSILQLIIGMISARYLGPSNYGLINYASSVIMFVFPLMQLGLQSTLVKELIEKPDKEGEIMGTALLMSLISGFCCIGIVYMFVSNVNGGDKETIIVCMLYSFALLFNALELMQCWFQRKLQSKYSSVVMLCGYIVVSTYKIYLLITQKNIYWFAIVSSIEHGLVGISLVLVYTKLSTQKLSFSLQTAKKLFMRSKYYILAAMMVTVFQNTDHIMLKMISGDAENGFYSAAITCAGVCQFVYLAITDSARPVILSYKESNSNEYEENISRLYCVTTYMAVIQSLGFTFFADLIVKILYGPEFLAAIPVLRTLVWYIAFVFMGSIRNIWILAEGKQSIVWKINLTGAILNILLNSILIPQWGACGAAFASLMTQIFINFILGFVVESLRENNKLLIKGLNPVLLLNWIRK